MPQLKVVPNSENNGNIIDFPIFTPFPCAFLATKLTMRNQFNITLFYTISFYLGGQNSQILRFGKICGKLALFQKYLAIYYFFST